MKLIATLIMACLAITLSESDKNITSFSDCNAQLTVEKNRESKSADQDGAQFILVLTNTSRDTKTFSLSAKNLSGPCNNVSQYNRGTNSNNSLLDITFQSNSLNRNSSNNSSPEEIELNSGESYKFIVNVKVPNGTPYNTWNCIEVQATSTDCKSIAETKTLSVFVVDPSEG